jgi:hypothetical protein
MSFSVELCRAGGETRTVGQHKVARLPVGKIDRRDTNCARFSASATGQGGRRKDEEAFHDVLTIEATANVAHSIAA